MQRFKKHFCDEYGRYSGGHPHMNEYGKFVYGANGTLCQYARWRILHVIGLIESELGRHMYGCTRDTRCVLKARNSLNRARDMRSVANLVWSRLDV